MYKYLRVEGKQVVVATIEDITGDRLGAKVDVVIDENVTAASIILAGVNSGEDVRFVVEATLKPYEVLWHLNNALGEGQVKLTSSGLRIAYDDYAILLKQYVESTYIYREIAKG